MSGDAATNPTGDASNGGGHNVNAAASTDTDGRGIYERMALLAGRRNVIDAEMVDAIASVIESSEWCGDGFRSVSHWLTIQFGLSPAQARRFEEVARRVGEFPLTVGQFRAGLLSLDQFRAVVLEAPSWADVNAFDLVQYATETQIRRIMRAEFPGYDPSPPSDSVDALDA